jgi:hypothetical protein
MNMSPPKTSTRRRSGRVLLATAFMVEPAPKTYHAALKTPEAEQWTTAVNTETTALDSHQAMEFMPEALPPEATVVNGRWLLSKKFKATGDMDKFKARFIAQGFTQKEGQDFDSNAISSMLQLSAFVSASQRSTTYKSPFSIAPRPFSAVRCSKRSIFVCRKETAKTRGKESARLFASERPYTA